MACIGAGFYRPRKLGHNFPRLYDIIEGETIANAFLQLNPEQRIGAEEALQHPYFAQLPKKLYELPDGRNFKSNLNFKLNEYIKHLQANIFGTYRIV